MRGAVSIKRTVGFTHIQLFATADSEHFLRRFCLRRTVVCSRSLGSPPRAGTALWCLPGAVAHEASLAVLTRELLEMEASQQEETQAAERMRERLAAEASHLQRKLNRVTRESVARTAEENAETQLNETARRNEAKQRAERARLAVRGGSMENGPVTPEARRR